MRCLGKGRKLSRSFGARFGGPVLVVLVRRGRSGQCLTTSRFQSHPISPFFALKGQRFIGDRIRIGTSPQEELA